MSITTITDNERRLLGEAQVLRALLQEALGVIDTVDHDDYYELDLLSDLAAKIRAALCGPAEFMPNQPLAPVASSQAAINTIAALDTK